LSHWAPEGPHPLFVKFSLLEESPRTGRKGKKKTSAQSGQTWAVREGFIHAGGAKVEKKQKNKVVFGGFIVTGFRLRRHLVHNNQAEKNWCLAQRAVFISLRLSRQAQGERLSTRRKKTMRGYNPIPPG